MSVALKTPYQVLADDVAMAIFRDCGFTLNSLKMGYLMHVPVAQVIAGYDAKIISQIAQAYPDTRIQCDGGIVTYGPMAAEFAVAVVKARIRAIVGDSPRFTRNHAGENWVFLGGDRRNHRDIPLSDIERRTPREEDDYVDLWFDFRTDIVEVVYGWNWSDCLAEHTTSQPSAQGAVREAVRRVELFYPTRVPG